MEPSLLIVYGQSDVMQKTHFIVQCSTGTGIVVAPIFQLLESWASKPQTMSPSLEAVKPGLEWKERLLLEEGQAYSNSLTGANLPLCRPQIPKLLLLELC